MLGNTYIFLVNIYIKMKNKIIEIIQNLNSILRKIRLYFFNKNELYLHLKPNVNIEKKWYGNSYGGFYVHSTPLNSNSIVYSIGIGKDISFDCKIIKKHWKQKKIEIVLFISKPISFYKISFQMRRLHFLIFYHHHPLRQM